MIADFFDRTVTIVHPAEIAGYGAGIERDYATGTSDTTVGWLHQLTEAERTSSTRDAVTATHVLRCPADAPIQPYDRIVVDGETFDLDGKPATARRPGGEHHKRVALVYVDG
jgi:hypothetical protein